MHIKISHETTYAYPAGASYLVQIARVRPRDNAGQRVARWNVTRSDRITPARYTDGFGNLVDFVARRGPVSALTVRIEGEVSTSDTAGVLQGVDEALPPVFYLRPTELTAASEELMDLALTATGGKGAVDGAHALMDAIREAVPYTPGATHAGTSAAEALKRGAGVCQDHAHLLIACARAVGVPARYVGGYLWPGEEEAEQIHASHAWAELWVDDLGWVGMDASNGVSPTPAYVRVAVGADYRQAAPFAGAWRGAGEERMGVKVRVDAGESAQ